MTTFTQAKKKIINSQNNWLCTVCTAHVIVLVHQISWKTYWKISCINPIIEILRINHFPLWRISRILKHIITNLPIWMLHQTLHMCSDKKLTLSKMLTRVKATKFFFWSFRNNQLSPSHHTLLREATVPIITPSWAKSTSKASPSRGFTLRSQLQSNIPDFTQKSPLTITEISICNHAASPLPHWRRVTPMRSSRTVIDNDEISCMQS